MHHRSRWDCTANTAPTAEQKPELAEHQAKHGTLCDVGGADGAVAARSPCAVQDARVAMLVLTGAARPCRHASPSLRAR